MFRLIIAFMFHSLETSTFWLNQSFFWYKRFNSQSCSPMMLLQLKQGCTQLFPAVCLSSHTGHAVQDCDFFFSKFDSVVCGAAVSSAALSPALQTDTDPAPGCNYL